MEKCAAMREEGYISMNPIIGNIITADKGGTAAQSDRNRARATACRAMFWSPRSEQRNGWE